jgi:thiamine phosphate synthase YjbQ (UPF0047 family)
MIRDPFSARPTFQKNIMVHQDSVNLNTTGHGHMHDITAQVQRAVAASRIRTGVAHVFAVGSTAALGVIEFEPGLQKDLPEMLNRGRAAPSPNPHARLYAHAPDRQMPNSFCNRS